jgi:hypothetical protein
MSQTADPKPPKTPALPDQQDVKQRPNKPVGPERDAGHPIETPPGEAERDQDPRSRDTL